MSHSPTTFNGEPAAPAGPNWDRAATLHRATERGGLFAEFKSVRRGTFAELIRFVTSLPADRRASYVIEKDGARRYDAVEIEGLSRRPDFPKGESE